jgi:hypothetical protein
VYRLVTTVEKFQAGDVGKAQLILGPFLACIVSLMTVSRLWYWVWPVPFRLACHFQIVHHLFETTKLTVLT